MSNLIKLAIADIIYHLKLSGQMPSILEAIAASKIITTASVQSGIEVTTDELQKAADSMRLAHQLFKAEDTWNWLNKHYLSLDDFEDMAKMNLLSAKLANHLFADKVEPFFYAHHLDYTGAVTYEVILDDEDLALEIFYALKEGEISFQEIARQYIQNLEIRRAGGYQGIRYRRDFRPEIAAAVFAATPPQILKPIVTPKGVHIIVVEEIITPQLDEQRRIQITQDLFRSWLEEQINSVEIVADINSHNNLQSSEELPQLA